MGKSENHLTDLLSWKFLISKVIRKVYVWYSCSESEAFFKVTDFVACFEAIMILVSTANIFLMVS